MPTPVLRDAAARVPRAANGTPPDEASGVTKTFIARRRFSIPEAPPWRPTAFANGIACSALP